MIQWQTGKPDGAIIVAKLTEGFTFNKESYSVLFLNRILNYYYDDSGEEIPYNAIEKWALIKE